MQAPLCSAVASLNIQMVNNRPDIQLKLYPIISDNKLTNYQPRFVTKHELYDLGKVLLQKKIMASSESLLKAQQDKFGYYFQVPVLQTNPIEPDTRRLSKLAYTEVLRGLKETRNAELERTQTHVRVRVPNRRTNHQQK